MWPPHRKILIALLLSLILLAGCGRNDNLDQCKQQLNQTLTQRNQYKSGLDSLQGQYLQLQKDCDGQITKLEQHVSSAEADAEYWRTTAENYSVTVGILTERTKHLQEKTTTAGGSSIVALIIEIILGIALICIDRSLRGVDTMLNKYKQYRTLAWMMLAASCIITVLIISTSYIG